jgi:hypothetical protein
VTAAIIQISQDRRSLWDWDRLSRATLKGMVILLCYSRNNTIPLFDSGGGINCQLTPTRLITPKNNNTILLPCYDGASITCILYLQCLKYCMYKLQYLTVGSFITGGKLLINRHIHTRTCCTCTCMYVVPLECNLIDEVHVKSWHSRLSYIKFYDLHVHTCTHECKYTPRTK